MADFNPDNFQNPKPSFPNMELLNNLICPFESLKTLNSSNAHHGLVGLSNDNFLDHQQPNLSISFIENFQSALNSDGPFYDPVVTHFLPSDEGPNQGKRMKRISETDELDADHRNRKKYVIYYAYMYFDFLLNENDIFLKIFFYIKFSTRMMYKCINVFYLYFNFLYAHIEKNIIQSRFTLETDKITVRYIILYEFSI